MTQGAIGMNLPGEIGEKYEYLGKLGEGGMGAVYKVRHRLLGVDRVIKVIRPQLGANNEMQRRFQREACTAIQLHHTHLAQIFDFSVDAMGVASIVMEFVDGETLLERLRRDGPFPVPLAIEVAIQALGALKFLHQRDFVHRDISADNLMLTENADGKPWVKLIDLGLAKSLTDGRFDISVPGMFVGKLHYAAPEQYRNGQPVDHRADLYSFGVLLYQLLTGCLPIEGETVSELVAGHLMEPPRDFADSDPGGAVPDALRAVVMKALAKDPSARVASAEDFIQDLTPFHESAAARAHPPEPFQPTGQPEKTAIPTPGSPSMITWEPGPASAGAPAEEIDQTIVLKTPHRTLVGSPLPISRATLGLVGMLTLAFAFTFWWIIPHRDLGSETRTQGVAESEPIVGRSPSPLEDPPVPPEAAREIVALPTSGTSSSGPHSEAESNLPEPSEIKQQTRVSAQEAAPSLEALPAPGTLIIDAVPWAEVLAIEDETGHSHLKKLRSVFTPLAVSLPASSYTVRLANGGLAKDQWVEAEVRPQQASKCGANFGSIPIESLFHEMGW